MEQVYSPYITSSKIIGVGAGIQVKAQDKPTGRKGPRQISCSNSSSNVNSGEVPAKKTFKTMYQKTTNSINKSRKSNDGIPAVNVNLDHSGFTKNSCSSLSSASGFSGVSETKSQIGVNVGKEINLKVASPKVVEKSKTNIYRKQELFDNENENSHSYESSYKSFYSSVRASAVNNSDDNNVKLNAFSLSQDNILNSSELDRNYNPFLDREALEIGKGVHNQKKMISRNNIAKKKSSSGFSCNTNDQMTY